MGAFMGALTPPTLKHYRPHLNTTAHTKTCFPL